MPFDARNQPTAARRAGDRRRIAIIGGGISGLSAGWLLADHHDVIVYDSQRRLGGHANTVDAPIGAGVVPVDAGFIVFNKPNYPNLTALFDWLGVETVDTDMSFGVSMNGGKVEFSSRGASALFANRASLASASHWTMLADIVRFNRDAKAALSSGIGDTVSLGEFVAARGFSHAFVRRFLEPMAASIWSTPSLKILDYPAASLFRFYENHGLLQTANMPRWNTVKGGSRRYVDKISAPLRDMARLGVNVVSVARVNDRVQVTDDRGGADIFDDVVIATPANRALAMLRDPSERERALLGAFSYQANRAVVHFDRAQMPTRRRAWASWNYLGGDGAASVTYWMNMLQNLDCRRDIFVTLNPATPIDAEYIVAAFDYVHPVFNVDAARAQKDLWSLQGEGGVWFCGAHFGSGFHEDGLQSGLAVAEDLGGIKRPWNVANESGRIWRHAAPLPLAAE